MSDPGTGAARRDFTARSSPRSPRAGPKQVQTPVWQNPSPDCATVKRSASRSQSGVMWSSFCVAPEVAPLRHSPREREW